MTNSVVGKDECYTPKWIFDSLGIQFDLDVASSYHPLIEVPTNNRYTVTDDALTKDWFGRVWMNPPFTNVTPWVDRWLLHGNGICLVPTSSNGKWANKLWDAQTACLFLPYNMWFVGADGRIVKHRWRCALFAIGDQNINDLRKLGTVKT